MSKKATLKFIQDRPLLAIPTQGLAMRLFFEWLAKFPDHTYHIDVNIDYGDDIELDYEPVIQITLLNLRKHAAKHLLNFINNNI